MRILFVTPEISSPPGNGGQIRKWNILQGLVRAGETDVLYFSRTEGQSEEAFRGCRALHRADWRHLVLGRPDYQRRYQSTIGRGLLTLSSRLPVEFSGDDRAALRATLRKSINFESYDVVFFATARMVFPVGKISTAVQILDGDDFIYVRDWLLLRSAPWYGAKLWNYIDVMKAWWWERSFARRMAAVIRCSTEDRNRHPAANVEVLPNGTNVPESVLRRPGLRVLFVGDLGYRPNAEGIEWFLEKVWPLIRRQLPQAEFDVVGRLPTKPILSANGSDGVTVHGFVSSLDTHYERAALSIAPLHAGGGTRLKILESLARGVPVVSTTIGAFGIPVDQSGGITRSDGNSAFAEACITHLHKTCDFTERAMKGREIVKAHYDWNRIQGQIADLVVRYAQAAHNKHSK